MITFVVLSFGEELKNWRKDVLNFSSVSERHPNLAEVCIVVKVGSNNKDCLPRTVSLLGLC